MAGVFFSHWLLDLIVHVRDLPLVGDRLKVGFGLWNYRIISQAIELGILIVGAGIYMTSLDASATGMWWFTFVLTAALSVVQLVSVFGPPPKAIKALAAGALAAYMLIPAIALAGAKLLTVL